MVRKIIEEKIKELAARSSITVPKTLPDDLVLFDLGLDSLQFAILVVELEESFGYDPFQLTEGLLYPSTFGEFVDFYATIQNDRK
jgi:hypothetical protein